MLTNLKARYMMLSCVLDGTFFYSLAMSQMIKQMKVLARFVKIR